MNIVQLVILLSWMERNHTKFHDQVKRTVEYLLVNRAALGFAANTLPGEWLDKVFVPAYLVYDGLYKAWEDPATRTRPDMQMLENGEKEFRVLYRQLYGTLKAATYVDDNALMHMGLPARGTNSREPSPIATEPPTVRVILDRVRTLVIEFGNAATGKRRKPRGQHGSECIYVISDHPVTSLDELIHSTFDTDSPLVLEFREEDRGKIVYFALRWENTRGEKGPFSVIFSAMIP